MAKSHISELLPTKYRKRHQLMLYLYDILVDILVKADKYQLSSLSFRFTNEINDEIEGEKLLLHFLLLGNLFKIIYFI